MEGRVGVVVTGELEEIVVMTDGLMTRTPKKLCDLLDVDDWLALYHVRSPALRLGVAYALLIYPGGSTRLQPTLTWKRSYLKVPTNMTLGVGSNSDSIFLKLYQNKTLTRVGNEGLYQTLSLYSIRTFFICLVFFPLSRIRPQP
jgi:hypothetical protein